MLHSGTISILSEVWVSQHWQVPDLSPNPSVGRQQAYVNILGWDTSQVEDLGTMPSVTLFIEIKQSITELSKLYPNSSKASN